MSLHRLTVTAALTASAALAALVPAVVGTAFAAPLPPQRHLHDSDMSDRLTVTVSESGEAVGATTRRLRCHPSGGSHSTSQAACEQLDQETRWGRDPFAPVPADAMCTRQYGGPATAHLQGHWAGRPVDAYFSRADGCEIARWSRMSEVLGTAGS
jgi:hypothetical protein